MATLFLRLIRFESDDHHIYFADTNLGVDCVVTAFASFNDLLEGRSPRKKLIQKTEVYPDPRTTTKPAAALANPGEDIILDSFRAESWPDYQGTLVFVTSRSCRDVSPSEAHNYILGYTIGNDITCRMHQFMARQRGQYFVAGAHDQLAPIGPALISPVMWESLKNRARIVTKLNGKVVQESLLVRDMVYGPARVLSTMSQGATIPAGTAVMTGTPAGTGMYSSPRRFLRNGDVVEVSIDGLGTLTNRIVFE